MLNKFLSTLFNMVTIYKSTKRTFVRFINSDYRSETKLGNVSYLAEL